jgi:hypothetical protein
VRFGIRGVILCRSHVLERVPDAGGVLSTGGKQTGGEGGKIGYKYSRSCDVFIQLVLSVTEHNTAQPS